MKETKYNFLASHHTNCFMKRLKFIEVKSEIGAGTRGASMGIDAIKIAALDLGRRRRGEEASELKKITSSKMIFEMMQPLIGELPHEEFWIIYVNNSNVILLKSQLSKGGITATLVDVRLIFKQALEIGATGIVLCHNHPSGNLKASDADIMITKKIKLAAENLDITILDHLIIADHGYLSFTDEGIL
jgi:DNA repair protein RadC